MTIKALYPTTRPSLDLNFARTRALDPRITYTRASAGTFVGSNGLIQSAAVNQARFDHNPLTGESLGLLLEEARTNSLWPSEPTTATARNTAGGPGNDWFVYDATVSSASRNGITGLEVTINSTLDTNGYQANFGGIGGGGSFSGSTTASLSFFIHPLTWTGDITVKKLPTDGNPTTGGFTQLFVSGVYTGPASFVKAIFPDGTYWLHNIAWTDLSTNTAVAQFPLILTTTPGDNIKKFWAGGFQWEAGAFSTSYIPTTGATVTRAADVANITGANFSSWYSQGQGTIFVNYINRNVSTVYAAARLGATNNEIRVIDNSNNAYIVNLGTLQYSQTTTADVLLKRIKRALAYATNNVNLAMDGTLYSLSTSATIPIVNEMTIVLPNTTPGPISRITYWPVRLPDAQLQALTQ